MTQRGAAIVLSLALGLQHSFAAAPTAPKPTRSTGKGSASGKSTSAAELPPLLKEVEAHYAQTRTMTAEFEETTQSATLGQTKKSSGKLSFKRPGKVRWETLKPDRNLLVSDGKKFWFYTPPFEAGDSGQYMVRPASQVQSRLAQALLSASFSSDTVRKSMKVQQDSPTEFTLIPKSGSAGTVVRAKIRINPEEKTIQAVELLHKQGNKANIVLSEIDLGKPLDDKSFVFSPPPNTERIQEN